jgi:hypothetical protein
MLESMGRGVLRMVFEFEKQRSGGDLLLGIRCRWIDNGIDSAGKDGQDFGRFVTAMQEMPVEFVQMGITIRRVGTEAVDTTNHSVDKASQDSGRVSRVRR